MRSFLLLLLLLLLTSCDIFQEEIDQIDSRIDGVVQRQLHLNWKIDDLKCKVKYTDSCQQTATDSCWELVGVSADSTGDCQCTYDFKGMATTLRANQTLRSACCPTCED